MVKKLFDSSLPDKYSKGLYEEKGYDLAAEHTDKIAYTLFTATSNVLKDIISGKENSNSNRAAAFEFNAIDGSVIAAAVVQYFENEDPSKPGNWNLVWTFDSSDIPDGAIRTGIKDVSTHTYFRAVAGDKYGIRFKNPAVIVTLCTYLLEQIHKWLDENAIEGEEVSVEQEAVFQGRVAIENGEKVFALEPAGEIKMLIKNDTAIEK